MNGHEGQRLRVEPLGRDHDRAAFSCGVDALDHYLKSQAGQDAKRNVAAPFVVVEEGSRTIAGYYTLSMTSVDLGQLPEALARRLPRYPKVPAVLLGRLAVDERFRGKGLGRFLLMDALARSLQNDIAWVVAVVEAKDEAAGSFYARYGFTCFADQPDRLFIHRRKVEEALGSR